MVPVYIFLLGGLGIFDYGGVHGYGGGTGGGGGGYGGLPMMAGYGGMSGGGGYGKLDRNCKAGHLLSN